MNTPGFFNDVPGITLYDPLAEFLGSYEGGVMRYAYADAVRLAGHSCPTVAGAYLMALKGLHTLYGEETPVRGGIAVEMEGSIGEGTTGVVANVFSLITGAAGEGGFKGIAGRYERRGLLRFGCRVGAEIRLVRADTGRSVRVDYDPGFIPGAPRQSVLMQKALSGSATPEERLEFGQLWQARVKKILCDFRDDPRLIKTVLSD